MHYGYILNIYISLFFGSSSMHWVEHTDFLNYGKHQKYLQEVLE